MYDVWAMIRPWRSKIAVTKSRASEKIGERVVRSITWPISLVATSSRLRTTETRTGSTVAVGVCCSAVLIVRLRSGR